MLSALLCFSVQKPHWTVAELSEALSVSMPTMYRYVALLREVGLLEPSDSNAYRVSERVIALAHAAQQGRSSLEDIAIPVLTRIRDRVDETVLVARRSRNSAYCVERVESRKPVRLQFHRGQPMSLHLGSMARILLANMPKAERDTYLASVASGLPSRNAELLSEESLRRVAESGFTQSFEEVDEGIWGAAAAIQRGGQVVAAIGVAAPIYRLNESLRERIIGEVRSGAAELSERLGESV